MNLIIASIALCVSLTTIDAESLFTNYHGPIAGNKSIQRCITGDRPENTEAWITTSEQARKDGYPAEEHVVLTEDGYLLTVHRIPGVVGAPPVFLQHGLISSSFDYVLLGAKKALAYVLFELGYDVWMGNARGNMYSLCHTNYSSSDGRFWNFSWDQMGLYDVPAEIGYITNLTSQDVMYVGHGMGTTMSYVMAIERPDIASKVKAIFSFAVTAYFKDFRSILTYLTPLRGLMQDLVRLRGTAKFLGQTSGLKTFLKYACDLTSVQRVLCYTVLYSIVGYDYAHFNFTLLPTILNHYLDSTSLLCFVQFFQENAIDDYAFQHYDYGKEGNLAMYNSEKPRQYDVTKIRVPVGIFWSTNDFFASPKDVGKFHSQLPNGILYHKVNYTDFTHFDYIWGIGARELVYDKLLSVMETYR